MKAVVFIDGGYLRALNRQAGYRYDPCYRRRLARTTDLSRTDVDLLELVLRYQTQPVIESMIDDVFRSSRRFTPLNVQNPALPALLGVSANTVQGRLRADSPLVRSGLVCIDTDGDLKALDRLNRLAAAPAGLTDLAALTPGDFAVVHRKAGFLWKHGEPEALADMLRAECEAKPDRPRTIGFRP